MLIKVILDNILTPRRLYIFLKALGRTHSLLLDARDFTGYEQATCPIRRLFIHVNHFRLGDKPPRTLTMSVMVRMDEWLGLF